MQTELVLPKKSHMQAHASHERAREIHSPEAFRHSEFASLLTDQKHSEQHGGKYLKKVASLQEERK